MPKRGKTKAPEWSLIKLDGSREPYDEGKVADAIFLAAQDVGGTDRQQAVEVADKVTAYLVEQLGRQKQISSRDVGDAVERVLIENHHVRTAKAYILNRDKKREEYEAKIRLGVHDDVGMSLNALTVMKNKYLQSVVGSQKSGEEGLETPREAFGRVAKALAGAEKGRSRQRRMEEEFLDVMVERRFLPGGRTLANAGTVNNQLANCFVMPFPDDIEGIFESVRDSSVLKKNGGGVGFSFSQIRPKGDRVSTTSGEACGPVALMAILDHASDIFLQAGGRRSGNMVTLADNHPDIFEFITCKESGTNLPHINYSIEVSDKLMRAVRDDEDWELVNPRTGKVTQVVSARSVLEQAARLAWKNGDPGMIFIDEINKYNPTPHVDRLNTVNLCGEQPLLSHEACNLGSINLGVHVTGKKGKQSTVGDYEVDWELLEQTARTGVRMLDNVVTVCTYPLEEVDRVVKSNRKIGLGVMGWADMLIKLGIPYSDAKATRLARKVMKFVQEHAWDESEKLAKEKGSFPHFEGSIWEKRGYKQFRNATVTTIAPTGSLSMVAECSGGIEPHFALAFFRKAWGDYELPEVNSDLVTALKRSNGVFSHELMSAIAKSGSIQEMEDIPAELRRVFVTSMDISGEEHVRMQAAFQQYTDNAVSKTINLPADASVEDVMEAFVLAWETKCKGITVYRDKSREVQVLNVGTEDSSTVESGNSKLKTQNSKPQLKSQNLKKDSVPVSAGEEASKRVYRLKDVRRVGQASDERYLQLLRPELSQVEAEACPECGARLQMMEGCATCLGCGYSHCSV